MRDSFMGMMINRSDLLNTDTWKSIREINDDMSASLMATAIANNPKTNQAYGCFYNKSYTALEFGIIDIDNFTRTTIAPLTQKWSAAGFTSDGTLYVILEDGNLATVNLETGANTIIGQTGLPIENVTSGTIDYRTDTFYYATSSASDNAVYAINLTTAQPTKLFDTPNQAELGGMFILYPNIAAGAPEAVTEMAVNFEGRSLEGEVTFRAPSMTVDGDKLTGSLTYTLTANGTTVGSGSCQPGEITSAPAAVNSSGNYSFKVTVANEAGSSDAVTVTRWIGVDTPKSPENVTLAADGLNFKLTWDAVTESSNGGYMLPSEITYKIIRYPDAVVVSENKPDTQFSETVTEPATVTSFYYTVSAVAAGAESVAARSNSYQVGSVVPPYSQNFETEESLGTFTIIDANKDGKTWKYWYGYVRADLHLTNQMDDWLITPPIKLEANKIYDLSFDIKGFNAAYPERYEVKIGSAATAEAMTTTLVEPTEIKSREYSRQVVQIIPETSGVYYIGFHGISDANKYYIDLDNLSISAPYSGETPGPSTDMTSVPDYDGKIKATITFKAPTVTSGDNKLDDITKIVVSRNGQVVHSFGKTEPGAECTFVDQAQSAGMYSYTVVAYNRFGAGAAYSADVRLGVELAAAPTDPQIVETSDGKVKISWTAPTTDINGFPLNPNAIRYTVLDRTANIVMAENLSDTQLSIDIIEPGSKQTFVFFYILSQTDAGINYDQYVYTPQIPVGTTYPFPWTESFAGGSITHAWGISHENGNSSWGVGPASSQPVANPQDGDGGLAAFMPMAAGEEALLYSAKINIPGNAVNPKLSFWYFGVAGANDVLEVRVAEAYGDFATLKTISIGDEGNGWHRVLIDLAPYKGKNIQIGFNGKAVTMQNLILIDNLRVDDIYDKNLAVIDSRIPARAIAGQEVRIPVAVLNNGLEYVAGARIDLFRDAECVKSEIIPTLAPDASVKVTLTDPVNINPAEYLNYSASIVWDSDMNAKDNTVDPVRVATVAPALPRITDLWANHTDDGKLVLHWGEPDFSVADMAMVESMEDAKSFAVNALDGWTFYDGDRKTTYAIEGQTFPNNGKEMAYIVVDDTHAAFTEVRAASGSKMLASFSCDDGTQNDDWAISPLLSGEAQTISFMARSFTTRYGFDSFEVLASSAGNRPEDFTLVGTDTRVPEAWTPYSFRLPEGTRYFAIRCRSNDTFMFLVDDIVFIPAAYDTDGLKLTDYRIYMDNEAIGGCPGENHTYDITSSAEDLHTYFVTAVYNQASKSKESAPSNMVRTSMSGLSDVNAASQAFTVRGHVIYVENPEGLPVSVCMSDGKMIHSSRIKSGPVVTVNGGVYIVTIGAESAAIFIP